MIKHLMMAGGAQAPAGQAEFTTTGLQDWVVPAGVTSICIVAVGAGSNGSDYYAGHGGGLVWANDVPVTPGETLKIGVGAGGVSPSNSTVYRSGSTSYYGMTAKCGGSPTYGVGGSGSIHASFGASSSSVGQGGKGGENVGGGGGAGGYATQPSQSTGRGGSYNNNGYAGANGSGGGGGGSPYTVNSKAAGGGGTEVYGQGASGAGGASYDTGGYAGAGGGKGGSGGGDGIASRYGSAGGYPGGGGGAKPGGGQGADGKVRIIWGANRAFPNTNTGDL